MTYRFWVWTMVAVTAACIVVDTMLLMVWNYSLMSSKVLIQHGWPLINLASLGSSLLGAMILLRYRTNAVGWLLSVVGRHRRDLDGHRDVGRPLRSRRSLMTTFRGSTASSRTSPGGSAVRWRWCF